MQNILFIEEINCDVQYDNWAEYYPLDRAPFLNFREKTGHFAGLVCCVENMRQKDAKKTLHFTQNLMQSWMNIVPASQSNSKWLKICNNETMF